MRQEFRRLLGKYNLRSESELENGLSAGEVHFREVGHCSHRVRQPFGSVVQEASFLGCHRGVALTVSMKGPVEPHYPLRQLADLPVKWRRERLHVWEIADPDHGP
jgi:hypothetical protein